MARIEALSKDPNPGRRLGPWQFVAVVIVYLAIIQLVPRIIGSGLEVDDGYETSSAFLRLVFLPIVLSALFAIGVATWLGWWSEIILEPKRVQSWVRIVPIGLLVAAAVGASWGNLIEQKLGLVLLFVALVLIVGFTEELMFRGIGLVSLRRTGISEGRVALYTSLIFGAAHVTNAISTGPSALLQAAVVSLSGYFFYLSRRRFGVIWIAMLVHSSQDFTLLSGQIGIDPSQSAGAVLVLLTMVVLAAVVFRRRHRIEP